MTHQEKREKVIRGLEICANDSDCSECPYNGIGNCYDINKRDALALLKGQEPVEPVQDMVGDALFWICGKCGHDICSTDWYCSNCGRAVKWE